jgi:hypothetical protein
MEVELDCGDYFSQIMLSVNLDHIFDLKFNTLLVVSLAAGMTLTKCFNIFD